MRILFVSANPHWSSRLDLGDEMRELLQSLRGQDIELMMLPAAQPEDLKIAVTSNQIDVLHFSGHATEEDGILLRDKDGMERAFSGAELRKLIDGEGIKLAFLNACRTVETAKEIEDSVGAVISTTELLDDEAAKRMTKSFYSALCHGGSIDQAFNDATAIIASDGYDNVYTHSGRSIEDSLLAAPDSDAPAATITGQSYYDKYYFISYLDEQIRSLKGRVALNRVMFWILFVCGLIFFGVIYSKGDKVELELLVNIFGQDRIDQYLGKPYLDSLLAVGAGLPALLALLQSRLTISTNQGLQSLLQMKEMAKSSENLTPELQGQLEKILEQCIRGADNRYQPWIDWFKVRSFFLTLFKKKQNQQT